MKVCQQGGDHRDEFGRGRNVKKKRITFPVWTVRNKPSDESSSSPFAGEQRADRTFSGRKRKTLWLPLTPVTIVKDRGQRQKGPKRYREEGNLQGTV